MVLNYYPLVKDMKNPFNLRLEMLRYLESSGSISETARRFETTRKTVRKWRERHKTSGLRGLTDRPRIPLRIPHKMDGQEERRIQDLRERHFLWGAKRLKSYYDIPWSEGAIYRVIRQRRLIKRRKKRWVRRRDLRQIKERLRPFQKVQFDTKDLSDMPEYYPAMLTEGLPRWQHGARCMATGAALFAYSNRNDSFTAGVFASLVTRHLKKYGVELNKVEAQTDNGSEFIGSPRRKRGLSLFESVLKREGIRHSRIPPRQCTWNSDIERFNGLIEEEFYTSEHFTSEADFMSKAYAYQIFFNNFRQNSWRDWKTPKEILGTKTPDTDPGILNLPPIRLEKLFQSFVQSGYHVPDLDIGEDF